MAEADRLYPPGAVIEDGGMYDDSADRGALEAMRGRIADSIIEAGLADLDARRAEHGERLQIVRDVPQSIEWDVWSPDTINAVLRAMWEYVELDQNLMPVRAEWTVPEWRRD
jgi:hypothetical protein